MARPPHDDEPTNGETPGARLQEFLESVSEELEAFARRRPLEGLLVSFIAGMVIGDFFRRSR